MMTWWLVLWAQRFLEKAALTMDHQTTNQGLSSVSCAAQWLLGSLRTQKDFCSGQRGAYSLNDRRIIRESPWTNNNFKKNARSLVLWHAFHSQDNHSWLSIFPRLKRATWNCLDFWLVPSAECNGCMKNLILASWLENNFSLLLPSSAMCLSQSRKLPLGSSGVLLYLSAQRNKSRKVMKPCLPANTFVLLRRACDENNANNKRFRTIRHSLMLLWFKMGAT